MMQFPAIQNLKNLWNSYTLIGKIMMSVSMFIALPIVIFVIVPAVIFWLFVEKIGDIIRAICDR